MAWQRQKQVRYRAVGKYVNCSGGNKEDGKHRTGKERRWGTRDKEGGRQSRHIGPSRVYSLEKEAQEVATRAAWGW